MTADEWFSHQYWEGWLVNRGIPAEYRSHARAVMLDAVRLAFKELTGEADGLNGQQP